MRRLTWLIATVVLCLGLTSCSGADPSTNGTESTRSSTTTPSSEGDTSGDDASADEPAPDPQETGADTGVDDPMAGGGTIVIGGDGPTCWESPVTATTSGIGFADVTATAGLIDPLNGVSGHAAAWGDVDGDFVPDLVVGTFATRNGADYTARGAAGPAPDRLLIGDGTGFTTVEGFPEMYGRSSGAALVDLDGDGDLDMVLSRNVTERDTGGAASTMLRNDGGGGFSPVEDSGLDPTLGGRSIGVLDIDEDGLLDLVVVVDRYRGGSSRIYRNLGDLRFEDATGSLGFPSDVDGLGIASSDLNGDGHTDVFVAGSNRLFVGTGSGLDEVDADELLWETYGNEDDVAGAAIADVNRDGLPDLLVGHHYNSTLSQGRSVAVRLYLNRTDGAGSDPVFEDVTAAAGLDGIPTKAPHVELVDLDNDGWLDILTSASAADGAAPAVFRGLGLDGNVPTFDTPTGMGAAQYWVAAPTADYNRDGRLDVLLVEWETSLPTLLLENTSGGGHWVEVSVDTSLGGGVGTRVDVYEAGGAGDPAHLVGSREIVATVGYTAGIEQIAHFGLGDLTEVDLVVSPPDSDPITLEAVPTDRHLRLPTGCV